MERFTADNIHDIIGLLSKGYIHRIPIAPPATGLGAPECMRILATYGMTCKVTFVYVVTSDKWVLEIVVQN